MNRRSVAVLLGLCLAAGSVFAQDAGMKAAVDSKGQLRQPTAEEMKQLEAISARFAHKPVKVQIHSSGRISIALDESFDHAYIATTDDSGQIVFSCFENPAEANEIVARSSTADTILRIHPMEQRTKKERE